jgi:hypothetical protein
VQKGQSPQSSVLRSSDDGQASPEWIGLLFVVALLSAGLVVATHGRLPGAALAHQIAAHILCAARLSAACEHEPQLNAAYGKEVARLVREHAPAIAYERRMVALPVDFRSCREAGCAEGPAAGGVSRSLSGQRVTAFVHVVEAGGSRYLQYWFYYPDSATLRGVPVAGRRGYHRDDWETLQVRIAPDGSAVARASSHHGYHHEGGVLSWGSDTGLVRRSGWGPESGWMFVSGGSHAGSATFRPGFDRYTAAADVRLVPLEPMTADLDAYSFAIVPPWRKRVYTEPEFAGT